MKEVYIDALTQPIRLVCIEHQQLQDIRFEEKTSQPLLEDCYAGKVLRIHPALQAAFIDIGSHKGGFLPLNELPDGENGPIESRLTEGQRVLVQVKKEPYRDKGAKLTMKIELKASGMVYLPKSGYVAVSKKIKSPEAKQRLQKLADSLCEPGEGLLFRTEAEGLTDEQLTIAMNRLQNSFQDLLHTFRSAADGALLQRTSSVILNVVKELASSEQIRVITNSRQFKTVLARSIEENVDWVTDEGAVHLFSNHGLEATIEQVLSSVVPLPGGGQLVIESLEALTVIDVNSGQALGHRVKERTIQRTNEEAAREIPRQLKLRQIGGMVVVDFIDMKEQHLRASIEGTLRAGFLDDKTRTSCLGFTALGLYEIVRKRTGQPLQERLTQPCPSCQGTGDVLSEEEFVRQLQQSLLESNRSEDEAALVAIHRDQDATKDWKQQLFSRHLPFQHVLFTVGHELAPCSFRVLQTGSLNAIKDAADRRS
ncbi:Rne/Rng family ribonuclease [Aureibacillus halotolerans]|uniref:RNAse G n=1 Tax=Aureibacillus halotolerans TaxID=1508390 RepID=A0A4V3D4Y3_9BACI|nr:Rne/Rng family ribonuclease [Aureibacillus halotolerans]TDQ37967.1 RNAse G [Aureibacillus halotolerans]